MSKCGDSVLEIMSRHLQNECRQRRRLVLRGLVVLSKDPSMARRMCGLSQRLLELLGDADGEVVSTSLCVFTNVLQHKDILVSSTTAPKLAEALLLLFDRDNSYVQVLSLELFFRVMDLVVDEGKKALEEILSQSLLPLFFYCHDENQRIAKASRETLLRVAEFLRRRKLKQLVKKEQLSKFAECLVRMAWKPQAQPGEAP
ncbi:engulfment and cell motility protein 3-like [Anomalospiza imberbis]|uniref:engulfment and cell motility protein 3-like n=1 Tax=Anomalospiza imberbis TaxID=187417 RepID=UPI00358E21D7